MNRFDDRQLAGLRLLPLPGPALQLALDVAVVAAEVTEAGGARIDRVDLDHGLDQSFAEPLPLGGIGEQGGLFRCADHRTLDELHHVERGPGDGVVLAVADDRRNRDRRPGQGGHDTNLAAHVVGRTQAGAERRPAEDPAGRALVGDQVGQVGKSPVDLFVVERGFETIDPLPEPVLEGPVRDSIRIGAHVVCSLRAAAAITSEDHGERARRRSAGQGPPRACSRSVTTGR